MVDRETIIRGAKIELARREFFFYFIGNSLPKMNYVNK